MYKNYGLWSARRLSRLLSVFPHAPLGRIIHLRPALPVQRAHGGSHGRGVPLEHRSGVPSQRGDLCARCALSIACTSCIRHERNVLIVRGDIPRLWEQGRGSRATERASSSSVSSRACDAPTRHPLSRTTLWGGAAGIKRIGAPGKPPHLPQAL